MAELTNVKTQLEEVNATLAAKEKELIKTQAAASESAGYIAEALRAELDSLGATTTQKVDALLCHICSYHRSFLALLFTLS